MHYYGETQGTFNTEIDRWLLTCTNQNQNQLFNDGCEQKLFFDHTPSACSSVKRRPHKKRKAPDRQDKVWKWMRDALERFCSWRFKCSCEDGRGWS